MTAAKKRVSTIFFGWTIIALAVCSAGMNRFLNEGLIRRSIPQTFDEKSAPVEMPKVRTYLVQPQENLSAVNKNSPPSSKENQRPLSMRHRDVAETPATDSSVISKEQAVRRPSMNSSSSAKESEAAFIPEYPYVQMRRSVTKNVPEELGRIRPRVIFLEGSPWTTNHTSKTASENATPAAYDETVAKRAPMPKAVNKKCVPMDWQKTFREACNDFHANDISDFIAGNRLTQLGSGYWRVGWKITHLHNDDPAVWKTAKFAMIEHEVSRQKTRNEAVAMERLQGSPRVVDIYGYCGMSVATEFVGGNNSVKATRGMTPVEKLSVAIALAQGVADVHSVDGGQPTLTHSDLTKHNVLFTPDRRPKLQDFNMAAFVKRDKETGKACGPNRSKYWGDIYALGDIIFTLAVETSTWTILNGKPKANVTYIGLFPDQVKKSSDPAMQVMIKAIEACFRKQNKRPTAQHIVAFLQNKTSTI